RVPTATFTPGPAAPQGGASAPAGAPPAAAAPSGRPTATATSTATSEMRSAGASASFPEQGVHGLTQAVAGETAGDSSALRRQGGGDGVRWLAIVLGLLVAAGAAWLKASRRT